MNKLVKLILGNSCSIKVLLIGLSITFSCTTLSREYYVAKDGNDDNAGTIEEPFKTIQMAADAVIAGDVCFVRSGVYKETVVIKRKGENDLPIRFVAMPGEKVILDGRETVKGKWEKSQNGTYVIENVSSVEQLFFNNEMMLEARWPNAKAEQLLSRVVWASTDKGSAYGKIVDRELAESGVDWTGANVILNVAHQFYTWKRPAITLGVNHGVFGYDQNLKGLEQFFLNDVKPEKWEDDYYYLTGSLGLLDAPSEWYYDKTTSKLFFYPPNSDVTLGSTLKSKVREFAFIVKDSQFIHLEGFEYFATTVSIKNCYGCQISKSKFLYPSFTKNPESKSATFISGNFNKILKSTFSHVPGGAISIVGDENIISEIIVNDTSWFGTLRQPTVSFSGNKNNLNKSELFDAGSVLVKFNDGANIIEFNDIYRGGLLSKDVALVYTQRPETYGSVVRYNWVHDVQVEAGEGICIRGDDLTRGLSIHNNVVWNCGHAGIVIKGDYNKIYNNTILSIGGLGYEKEVGLLVPKGKETFKLNRPDFNLTPWQNLHSLIANNITSSMAANRKGARLDTTDKICGNYHSSVDGYFDLDENKFSPISDSPLVDSGCHFKYIPMIKSGNKIDIGAYEFGLPYWKPGVSDH
ncbi:right-handed parallel beta-helix repeat-containing protein [Aliiglaciecola sp. 2_MG-2023]|uniref:right-handed parallel beta-helix repeat-containing protein n=1 Tax=unclassified Aliiglaciecola TaxID=2593648 RepID=UPI0026E45FB8|nr:MULTISPECIES: right-handed parallel beta-helix repeat-containing protein [unclassified Aliiglaciecola]MDO6709114.1 right-handed parallel beta-helix repeat-containing protein [Aliiglaciecola sp. 2_MG-2023]MDO6750262.1 right-handed parallel beta-helix repeat-containing protein [Aliiglaciecola sp. 1_MG-2023]